MPLTALSLLLLLVLCGCRSPASRKAMWREVRDFPRGFIEGDAWADKETLEEERIDKIRRNADGAE